MADFDVAVIGAGAAGLSVTSVAARLGLRVALIERNLMGGDCLNYGCVPSKALLAAAHAAEAARRAARFGVRLPEPDIDWAGVQAHVRTAIATLAPLDSEARFRALGVEVLRDTARFVGPDALAVGGRQLTARRIVIAAGSRAAVPDIPGLDHVPFLTNETLFETRERPAHLLIIGGGAVGLEMAQAHCLLGSRVTLVEAGNIAAKEDAELAARLRDVLTGQGVNLLEHARLAAVEPGPTLALQNGRRLAGTHLLVSAGRRPNVEDLGLEAGQVRASPDGIATDKGLRSLTNPRVFAVGDIADPAGIGPRAFTHVGSYHAGVVIRRAVFKLPARIDYAALPRVTYTTPELAQVGMTEAEAQAVGHRVEVLRWKLAENDRAVAEADPVGCVKLVVARGRLIGAGILASHAGEMLGACALAVNRRVSLAALASMVLPYPTRVEAVKRAAGTSFEQRLFAPRTKAVARALARLP